MTEVSVVIRCLNEARHIGRLLEGLLHQTLKPDEIVVVDSGSTDGTLDVVRRYLANVVSITPEQFSFGRSLNTGFRAARGDIVVLASAHVYPLFDTWLEALTAAFAEPDVALTYGRQQGDERTRFSEWQVFAKWFPQTSTRHQDHPFCNNANAAVRRSVWTQLPYDESLTGLEDLDWAKRAMRLGHRISYVADAAVAHVHEENRSQVMNRYRREAIAYKVIFPDQRMSLLEALRLAAGNTMSDYLQAARERKLLSNLIDIPAFRTAQFWGSYHGFQQKGLVSAALRERFYYPRGFGRPDDGLSQAPTGRLIQYEKRDSDPAQDLEAAA